MAVGVVAAAFGVLLLFGARRARITGQTASLQMITKVAGVVFTSLGILVIISVLLS